MITMIYSFGYPLCELSQRTIQDDVSCTAKHPVYLITCLLCQEQYVGESSRTLHDCLSEHLRFATSPDNKNYKDEALALHY